MLILANTTDKLSLITPFAVSLDVVVTYVDRTTSSGAVGTAAATRTEISTASTTDICAAPSSGVHRKVSSISVRNQSSSGWEPTLFLIVYNANGTLYDFHEAYLLPGEVFTYDEDHGFEVRRNYPNELQHHIVETDTRNIATTLVPIRGTASNPLHTVGKTWVNNDPLASNYIGFFAAFCVDTAITTTGPTITPIRGDGGTNSYRHGGILNATRSATAATVMSVSADGLETEVTFGTGIVGASTPAFGFLFGGGCILDAIPTLNRCTLALGLSSEVGNSAVLAHFGTWMEVFGSDSKPVLILF